MKKLLSLILSLLLLLGLTGCGVAGSASRKAESPAAMNMVMSAGAPMEEAAMDTAGSGDTGDLSSTALPENRKWIITVYLNAETEALDEAVSGIDSHIREMGGDIWYNCEVTRINVKIHAGQETEINGIGPQILPCELQQLMTQLGTIEAGDTVVFSGSIPKCLASDTYGKLMDCLPPQVRTVVDATGEALRCALSRKPYLVKPNLPELEDFFGIPMDTKEKVEFAARKMQEMGAKNVLVSMAAQGAMLLDEYAAVAPVAPAAAAPVAAAAPAAEPEPAPGTAGKLKLHDVEPKTAAIIMAIVADKMGKPLNELRFISIKEVK